MQQPDQMRTVPPYGHDWAFFLDVDGTLLQLAEHPQAVKIEPELRDTLQDLMAVNDHAVALISGRSLDDLDRLFAPLQLPAAGTHGNERRDASGRLHPAVAANDNLPHAREQARDFAEAHPGCFFEDKGSGFALHFRQMPAAASAASAMMTALLDKLGDDYTLQHGKMVIEIRPAAHDKGSAILAFLHEPPFADRVPVFIGDDLSDEDGFRLVCRFGGIAIKVGEGETAAQWRLPDSHAVCDWLRGYIDHRSRKTATEN